MKVIGWLWFGGSNPERLGAPYSLYMFPFQRGRLELRLESFPSTTPAAVPKACKSSVLSGGVLARRKAEPQRLEPLQGWGSMIGISENASYPLPILFNIAIEIVDLPEITH